MVRQEPFGEWVNVFFDPEQTDTVSMLDLIIKEKCPNAKQTVRTIGSAGFVLNPMIAPGDPVQLEVFLESESKLSSASRLPKGWAIFGDPDNIMPEGQQIVTLITAKETAWGDHPVEIVFDSGQTIAASLTVVEQVGRH